MWLADGLYIRNISHAMPRRTPGFFEHLMRNEVHALDQQVPVKAILFKIGMSFQDSKVFYWIPFTRTNAIWPPTF
jgi:hypothetical protein